MTEKENCLFLNAVIKVGEISVRERRGGRVAKQRHAWWILSEILVTFLLVYEEVYRACLRHKSCILSFAKGVFPHLTPPLLSCLSRCSQMHAGSTVVYTPAHAPKEGVMPNFFLPLLLKHINVTCAFIFSWFFGFFWFFCSKGRHLCYRSWLCPSSNVGCGIWLSFAIFLMSGDDIGAYCVWKVITASSAVFHEGVIMELF